MGLKDFKLFPEEQISVAKIQGRTNTRQSPRSGARASPHRAHPSAHHPAQSPRAPILLPKNNQVLQFYLSGFLQSTRPARPGIHLFLGPAFQPHGPALVAL